MRNLLIYLTLVVLTTCTLNPPPITFTQSPTAAERQMLGDGKEIEKDGWILSSVRSSASGSEVWEKEVLDKELYEKFSETNEKQELLTRLRILAYLAGEVRVYKRKDFLGEAISGKLAICQLWKDSPYKEEFPTLKERIETIIQIVNENRDWIYKQKLEILEKQNFKPKEFEKEKNKLLLSYYNQAELGECIELKPNVWKRKE